MSAKKIFGVSLCRREFSGIGIGVGTGAKSQFSSLQKKGMRVQKGGLVKCAIPVTNLILVCLFLLVEKINFY